MIRSAAICSALLLACFPSLAFAQGAVGALRRLLESGRVPAERQATILEMICARGEADDLAAVVKLLDKPEPLSPAAKRRVIEMLADASITRKVKPSGELSPLLKLIQGEEAARDRALKASAIRLAATWKLPEAAEVLRPIATSEKTHLSLRQAAIDGLAAIGGQSSQQMLAQMAKSGEPATVRILAAAALSRLDVAAGAAAAAELMAAGGPQADLGAALDALLGRKDGADKLAAALAAKQPTADAAKMALRHIYSVGRSDQELSDVLSKAAGIALDAPPPSQEEVAKVATEVSASGDAARGEKIFRRADLSCMKCHAVAQAGGSVGPELSAVGSISPADYIVNSILNPNLAIKEQFVTRRVLTAEGQIVTGIQVDRDDQRLRLRDATGKIVSIPINEIEQEGEGNSLMPQGLTKFLTKQEFLDLARFVSELGKPGPYAIRKEATIQRWRVLKEPSAELKSQSPNVEMLREQVLDTSADEWLPVYATVGGSLPLGEMAAARPAVLYLQGEIDVSQAGPIAIEIASTEPTHIWLDAEPFEAAKRIERPLAAGRHTLTLRVEVSDGGEPQLRVLVARPEGSPAQFVVVSGM